MEKNSDFAIYGIHKNPLKRNVRKFNIFELKWLFFEVNGVESVFCNPNVVL